jgi:DNA-binding GntR family transcriptional regulator
VLIYQQVADWILQQIQSGAWPEHYQLPSEIDLATRLGVSRGTVRKAIADLLNRGSLVVIHGRGTFVSSRTLEQSLADRLVAFSEDLIEQGIPYATQVIEQRLIAPPRKIASLLAAEETEQLFLLKRVRTIHQTPIVVLDNYVSIRHCPGIEQIDFRTERLFQTLEGRYGLELGWGWRTFQAKRAPEAIATLLGDQAQAPVMYMEQLVYLKNGEPIEYSNIWLRGESFRLSAVVMRDKSPNLHHSFNFLAGVEDEGSLSTPIS